MVSVPRPSLFYAVLPLLCIILNTEQRTNIGGGPGMRLKWYQALPLCGWKSLRMKATWMDIVNLYTHKPRHCECTITPKVFCKSKTLNSRYLEPNTVMQCVQIVERLLSRIPEQCFAIVLTKILCYVLACIFDQCPSYCLISGIDGFQMSSILIRWFPNVKHSNKMVSKCQAF